MKVTNELRTQSLEYADDATSLVVIAEDRDHSSWSQVLRGTGQRHDVRVLSPAGLQDTDQTSLAGVTAIVDALDGYDMTLWNLSRVARVVRLDAPPPFAGQAAARIERSSQTPVPTHVYTPVNSSG